MDLSLHEAKCHLSKELFRVTAALLENREENGKCNNCHRTFWSGDTQKKDVAHKGFVIPIEREEEEEVVAFPSMESQGRKPPATHVQRGKYF